MELAATLALMQFAVSLLVSTVVTRRMRGRPVPWIAVPASALIPAAILALVTLLDGIPMLSLATGAGLATFGLLGCACGVATGLRGQPRWNLRRSWGVSAAVMLVAAEIAALAAWWGHPVGWVLAFLLMGRAFARFSILAHEAAHRLLFSNRRANDLIGISLLGWIPWGSGTHDYRRVHQAHHRDEFGPNEPDFLLYSLYPITRASFRRKLRRDALGVSAWRQVRPAFRGLVSPGERGTAIRFLGMQAAILTGFVVVGKPWLWLFLWFLPYFTWYQILNRLRALAEHAGMTRSADRRETTHIVRPSLWSRLFLAPSHVGYHLPHHVDSGIPMRNLPRLQEILIEDGYVPDHLVWPSYVALWRACVTGRAD